jgi:hypothetical protein
LTLTVNVALCPAETVADEGESESQFEPDPSVVFVAIVTFPLHAPLTEIVKVFAFGEASIPSSALKLTADWEGDCNEQEGWMLNVTGIWMAFPSDAPVELSVAVIVTEPLYVPALRPEVVALRLTVLD